MAGAEGPSGSAAPGPPASAGPAAPGPPAPAGPAAPGPPQAPLRTRVLRAVLVGVFLQLLFAFFFVVPGHDPQPRGLPVGVVDGPEAGALDRAEGIDVERFPDERAAAQAVRDREVYGVVARRPLIASGASFQVATLLRERNRAAGLRPPRDLAPLPAGDPRGTTLNLLVLPMIITAILGAMLAVQFAPDLDTRGRVLITALVGALSGAGAIGLVKLLDALPGSFLAEAGLAALAIIAIALVGAGLIRLIGPPGILAAFLLFLMLGNPASGLASAPELLPTPWQEIGPFLPPGALGSALRGTAYFDGAKVLGPVLVLVGWALVGLALHVLADRRGPKGAPPAAPQPAAA